MSFTGSATRLSELVADYVVGAFLGTAASGRRIEVTSANPPSGSPSAPPAHALRFYEDVPGELVPAEVQSRYSMRHATVQHTSASQVDRDPSHVAGLYLQSVDLEAPATDPDTTAAGLQAATVTVSADQGWNTPGTGVTITGRAVTINAGAEACTVNGDLLVTGQGPGRLIEQTYVQQVVASNNGNWWNGYASGVNGWAYLVSNIEVPTGAKHVQLTAMCKARAGGNAAGYWRLNVNRQDGNPWTELSAHRVHNNADQYASLDSSMVGWADVEGCAFIDMAVGVDVDAGGVSFGGHPGYFAVAFFG